MSLRKFKKACLESPYLMGLYESVEHRLEFEAECLFIVSLFRELPPSRAIELGIEYSKKLPEGINKVQMIAECMERLTPKETQVIRSRLGLDGMEKTLKQIGIEFSLTVERVRQIETKALSKLKRYILTIIKRKEESIVNAEEVEDGIEQNNILQRSVDTLEISIRVFNCLHNAKVYTIGELVQKSEAEMLKFKNFSKKSLLEVKYAIHKIGLSLKKI